jgi:hypothetical protein
MSLASNHGFGHQTTSAQTIHAPSDEIVENQSDDTDHQKKGFVTSKLEIS